MRGCWLRRDIDLNGIFGLNSGVRHARRIRLGAAITVATLLAKQQDRDHPAGRPNWPVLPVTAGYLSTLARAAAGR